MVIRRNFPLLVLVLAFVEFSGGESAPSWVSLCGKAYLFSDDVETWAEAGAECRLYGGYLVRIESLHENNCLVAHAMQAGLHDDRWWTAGERPKNNY